MFYLCITTLLRMDTLVENEAKHGGCGNSGR